MIFQYGRNPEAQQGFAKINEYMPHVYPYGVTGYSLSSFLLATVKNDEKDGFGFLAEVNASFHQLQRRLFIRTDTIVINNISWPGKSEANKGGESNTSTQRNGTHAAALTAEKGKKKIIANYFKRLTDQSFIT